MTITSKITYGNDKVNSFEFEGFDFSAILNEIDTMFITNTIVEVSLKKENEETILLQIYFADDLSKVSQYKQWNIFVINNNFEIIFERCFNNQKLQNEIRKQLKHCIKTKKDFLKLTA